jgi:hypothetical protein
MEQAVLPLATQFPPADALLISGRLYPFPVAIQYCLHLTINIATGSWSKVLLLIAATTAAFWPTIPTSACIKIRMLAHMAL